MSLPHLVIALALTICAAGHDVSFGPSRLHTCRFKDPLMDPIYEVLHGQDTVWQIPPDPKAIVFLAHGWKCDPFSYFDRSPGCEKCYGLPEDRTVVLDALRRGYAVISVKSIGGHYDSWPLEESEDLVVVPNILHNWTLEHSIDSLPWVLFGNSAGGYFATSLTTRIPTLALLLMCSQGQPELMENANREAFPPTFFAYVGPPTAYDSVNASKSLAKWAKSREGSQPTDDEAVAKLGDDSEPTGPLTTMEDVEEAMANLIDTGVTVGWKRCPPRPVTPHFFTERIPCMIDDASEKIQRAYKAEGWLDGENYLTVDPTSVNWTVPLLKWNAMPAWYEPAGPDHCSIDVVCQELMKSYAFHGSTGDANEEMYSWLDSLLALSDIPTNIDEFHANQ